MLLVLIPDYLFNLDCHNFAHNISSGDITRGGIRHGTLYGLSSLVTAGIKEMAMASLARSATSSVISRLKMELVIRGLLHARIAMPGVSPCSETCQRWTGSSRHGQW